MPNVSGLRKYLSLRDYCREECDYNSQNNRISRQQFLDHLNSKKHVIPDTSVIIESLGDDSNELGIPAEYFGDSGFDSTLMESVNNFNSEFDIENEGTIHNIVSPAHSFSDTLKNLSSTEQKFYFWYKIHGNFIPREAIRGLIELISSSSFSNSNIPTEYKIKKIDKHLESLYFGLQRVEMENKIIFIMPISEIVDGMMKCTEFQYYILVSNGILFDNKVSSLKYYYGDTNDIIFGEKFQTILSGRKFDTLHIGLVVFSDDFAKEKRSKWCPIDALYLAFGNFPLKERFKHHNVFIFSIIDHFDYYQSIEILQKSIIEFNNRNEQFQFNYVDLKFKIKVFIQLFSCDNPRTMNILNLSTGKPNIYCRSCLISRKYPSQLKEMRNINQHTITINGIKNKSIKETKAMTDFGIKYVHDLNLLQFQYLEPFSDFPFDILHSVYLGLVKHALTDTFGEFDSTKKENFLKYYNQLNMSGITYLPKGNIIRTIHSMTGKDFKAIAKVMYVCLLNVEDSKIYLNAWNYISYVTKFVNLKNITPKLLDNFENFIKPAVEFIGKTFPTLSTSVKLHLCLHIKDNISRHGTPLGYSTEVFESFNKILRAYISRTNQHNYSNDAISKYYESFRANFIHRNIYQSNNYIDNEFFNDTSFFEISELKFTTKIFSGFIMNLLISVNSEITKL